MTAYVRPPFGMGVANFSIGVKENGKLAGVAICGRPVSRHYDDGYTLEINRLCTDGTKNVCSILYGAACRAAKAMGYRKVITYILQSELGTSLKASGFQCEGIAGGLAWNGERKPKQENQYPHEMKTRWVRTILGGTALWHSNRINSCRRLPGTWNRA